MEIEVAKWWNIIIENYFSNDYYSICNDPNITYQEVVLIANVRDAQHYNAINAGLVDPIPIIDTDDFFECEPLWNEYYIASFSREATEKDFKDWDKVIVKRCDCNNLKVDKNGKKHFFWEDSPYKELLKEREKNDFRTSRKK